MQILLKINYKTGQKHILWACFWLLLELCRRSEKVGKKSCMFVKERLLRENWRNLEQHGKMKNEKNSRISKWFRESQNHSGIKAGEGCEGQQKTCCKYIRNRRNARENVSAVIVGEGLWWQQTQKRLKCSTKFSLQSSLVRLVFWNPRQCGARKT